MPTRIFEPLSSGDATAASRESTSPSPPASEPGAGSKRRRSGTTSDRPSNRRRNRSPSASAGYDTDEDVYDPDQPLEERRSVQQGYRDLLRDITENGDVYLDKDSVGLHETILKANTLSKQLRQTTEASIDSRLLVSTTDLSYRKTLRLVRGSLLQGLDCDDFVSHCIAYMRRGGGIADDDAPELSSTQRLRRRRSAPRRRPSSGAVQNDEYEDDDDDDEDSGDMMNWPHLGRFACLPHSRRPGLAGFLLGPLSLEKKARRVTKRSAPFRPNALTETRPEVLDVADMAKKENDLTAICAKILQQLYAIQADIQGTVADLIHNDMDDDEKTRIMHQHGLRSTGGIDLLRFVINPKSFAQTVENIFYVSFLVRDGRVEIDFDELDIPALAPVDREPDEEQDTSRHGAAKHQAVLSMNVNLWREAVDFFRLTEPMIEHRPETALPGPGARGWYS